MFCRYIIKPSRLPLFQWHYCWSQFPYEELVLDLLLGAVCSPELHCHHNSPEQYFVHPRRISCSSVTHFWDLSLIVEDLPCFSEVRSFFSWYVLLLLFLFRQVSISSHWAPIQSSFAFFTAFWILLFASLYCFAPASYHFISSHQRGQEHLWWPMAFSCDICSQVSQWLHQSLL